MSTVPSTYTLDDFTTHFYGLAPFARTSLNGGDLLPLGQALLARTAIENNNPFVLINLSLVLQSIGQHDIGIAMQREALALQRVYHIRATQQPPALRLLVLCVAGDIAENTPIDCLLEDMDIDLIFYYVHPSDLLADPIPEHDVLMVGICESDDNSPIIQALIPLLENWSKPIINKPQHIVNTGRKVASLLLQGTAGLIMPATFRTSRQQLIDIVQTKQTLSHSFSHTDFPVILRPLGSHAGRDLERINTPEAMLDYLDRVQDDNFYISSFIDYSAADGRFRKFRIVLIDGQPYIAHMAVSSHWMIHYVNAGMYEDGQKRAEEAYVMAHFEQFIAQHQGALTSIYQRTKLDYLGIDCAETQDGKLLIFEIDHVMVVHDMDPEDLFPYKHATMLKAKQAFRHMLAKHSENKAGHKTPYGKIA